MYIVSRHLYLNVQSIVRVNTGMEIFHLLTRMFRNSPLCAYSPPFTEFHATCLVPVSKRILRQTVIVFLYFNIALRLRFFLKRNPSCHSRVITIRLLPFLTFASIINAYMSDN